MKKILLNILTHGDETIGLDVANTFKSKYPNNIGNGFDIQIANKEAHKAGKRFLEMDLNRAFPGKKDGVFEERLAQELAHTISQYDLVIDIHSTESGAQDMIIITKLDEATKKVIEVISPKYVLHMDMRPDTSLISQAKIGIAFERGSNSDRNTLEKTLHGIELLLSHFLHIPEIKKIPLATRTEHFRVFTPIEKPKGAVLLPHIQNFSLIKEYEVYATVGEAEIRARFDFYPVIFGNTNYETIFGFAAEKLV